MRCTSCGLPLSPARTMTSCPRCGTPIVSEKKSALPVAQRPFPETISWEPVAPQIWQPKVERGSMERMGGVRSGSDGFHAAGADVQSDIPFPPASPAAAMYVQQPASLSPSTPAEIRGSAPRNMGSNVQLPQVLEHGEAGRGSVLSDVREQEEVRVLRASPVLTAQYQPWQPGNSIHRPARRSTNNRGFIVAGVCVIMGGLLLVFVYFMAMGLPGSSSGSSTAKTNSASNSLPTTASSPVSSPAATPFPGQKYIDHAQLAI